MSTPSVHRWFMYHPVIALAFAATRQVNALRPQQCDIVASPQCRPGTLPSIPVRKCQRTGRRRKCSNGGKCAAKFPIKYLPRKENQFQ